MGKKFGPYKPRPRIGEVFEIEIQISIDGQLLIAKRPPAYPGTRDQVSEFVGKSSVDGSKPLDGSIDSIDLFYKQPRAIDLAQPPNIGLVLWADDDTSVPEVYRYRGLDS